jgi:EmrB/QacA subfamily drug resistance transporter
MAWIHRMPQPYVVAAVFVAGTFMSIMDSTVVNTALPAIARQFHTTAASADWVVIGYLLTLAASIPASGWVGDLIGTKRTFLLALIVFSLASALCGLAGTLRDLVVVRMMQGAGGGMLAPVGQAMLYRVFPPAQRARASAILIIPTVLAPASGPVIGGLLVDRLSWHWVFFVNLPVGFAALMFGLLFLQEHREPRAGGFDAPGLLLAGIGLASLLYAISEGPLVGWATPQILGSGALGLGAIAVLVRVELRRRAPMLDLHLFRNGLFTTSCLVSFWGGAGFSGILFVLPQFLQEARGATALQSGLTTFPEAIGVILSTQLVARLYGRVGPRRLMAGGLAGVAVAMSLLATVGLGTSPWIIRFLAFLVGVGMAYMIMPLQAASFAQVSSRDTGRASALFNTQRQVASAVGVALLGTVLSATLGTNPAAAAGLTGVRAFHIAFLAGAALAALGAVNALRVRDRDAYNTMGRGDGGTDEATAGLEGA